MENNKLKHIAIIEADTPSDLLSTINSAIDKYQINLIHYNIEQARSSDPYKDVV